MPKTISHLKAFAACETLLWAAPASWDLPFPCFQCVERVCMLWQLKFWTGIVWEIHVLLFPACSHPSHGAFTLLACSLHTTRAYVPKSCFSQPLVTLWFRSWVLNFIVGSWGVGDVALRLALLGWQRWVWKRCSEGHLLKCLLQKAADEEGTELHKWLGIIILNVHDDI